MVDQKGLSSEGVVSDDQLHRTVSNKQRVNDKVAKKNLKPSNPSSSVHCVCSSSEDSGHMVKCEACSQWSHSKCVGIILSVTTTYPYVCPFCIKSVFSQIEEVRTEVSDLRRQLSFFESSINCDVSPPVLKFSPLMIPFLIS